MYHHVSHFVWSQCIAMDLLFSWVDDSAPLLENLRPDEQTKAAFSQHFCRFTKESQSVTRSVGSLSNQFHLFFLLLWKIGGWEGRDSSTPPPTLPPPQYNPPSISPPSPYISPPPVSPVNPTVLPIPGMAGSSVRGGRAEPCPRLSFYTSQPISPT